MTGDYNRIHRWDWYARLFGFPRAFFLPQMTVGQCIAHLPVDSEAQRPCLDLWIRGPVYFNSDLRFRAASLEDSMVFALVLRGDKRPAILGRMRTARTEERLGDAANGQAL